MYGFDTGFVCFARGWQNLRPEDEGILWEHIVLNELQGYLPTMAIYYWRNKQHHEIDFVLPQKMGPEVTVIECKKSLRHPIDVKNIEIFRKVYPEGKNYVVVYDLTHSHIKNMGPLEIEFVSLPDLIEKVK